MARCRMFFLLLAMILSTTRVFCVPADPSLVKVTQADGTTLSIRIWGDEFFHYTTTSDGYNIVQRSDGFYYYARLSGNRLAATAIRAHNPNERSATERGALQAVGRGVPAATTRLRSSQNRLRQRMPDDQQSTLPLYRSLTRSSTERFRSLIILVSFADRGFRNTDAKQRIENMLMQDGYSDNGATGSAWNYYYDNSNQQFNPEFVVAGPYTLPSTMATYGDNDEDGDDKNAAQMIIDACKAADNDVNFADYAQGGVIRDIFVIYAGFNEAEGGGSNTIWPHRWEIYPGFNCAKDAQVVFDGVRLRGYACASELKYSTKTEAPIGTFCHEFGHVIGWPDFYNTGSEKGNPITLSTLSLMSGGSYNNDGRTPPALSSFERYMAGWLEFEQVAFGGSYSLKPLQTNHGLMINTSNQGEAFYMEYRDRNYKWDRYLSGASISSRDGMVVYHVDRSSNRVANGKTAISLWSENSVNNYADHECMKVVRPSSSSSVTDWFYPGTSSYTTLNESNSEFRCWSGESNGYSISNIVKRNGVVGFDVATTRKAKLSGLVTDFLLRAVEGATVTIEPLESSTNRGIRRLVATRADQAMTLTTAGDGKFVFDQIEPGYYSLAINHNSFNTYRSTVTLSAAGLTENVTLTRPGIEDYMTRFGWHGEQHSSIGGNDEIFTVQFDYNDVVTFTPEGRLVGMEFWLVSQAEVEAVVWKNDQKIATLPVSEPLVGGWTRVDLTELNLWIDQPTDYVRVGIDLNHSNESYPLGCDDKAGTNKGALYFDGNGWNVYADGNWMIDAFFAYPDLGVAPKSFALDQHELSIMLSEQSSLSYKLLPENTYCKDVKFVSLDKSVATVDNQGTVTGIGVGTTTIKASTVYSGFEDMCKVTVSDMINGLKSDVWQNDALISWEDATHQGEWQVEYGVVGAATTTKIIEGRHLRLDNLVPNTEYRFVLTIIDQDRTTGTSKELTFKTEPTEHQFAWLGGIVGESKRNQRVEMHLMDVQGTLNSIEWRADGKSVDPTDFSFSTAGIHTIEALFGTADGQKERIIKKIKVD